MSKDLEGEEDAPHSAIRELKSLLLSIPLAGRQESMVVDLRAVTARNGMCLQGLARVIWEGNAGLVGKEETFPLVNKLA